MLSEPTTSTTPDPATTPAPSSPQTSLPTTLTDAQADALAEALITRPHSDIAARLNLTHNQLAAIAKTPAIAERISNLRDLQALRDTAIQREQIEKLREVSNTSDDPNKIIRAAIAILRHTAIMARIALGHSRRSPTPTGTPRDTTNTDAQRVDSTTTSSDPQAHTNSGTSPDALPPLIPLPRLPAAPPPSSCPNLITLHQLDQLRKHKPKTAVEAMPVLYNHLHHPIQCYTNRSTRFQQHLDASTLLQNLDNNYEDLGPADLGHEVVAPAPVSPDLTLKPTIRNIAYKRIAIPRENAKPLYLRFHLAEQELKNHDKFPRWALEDIAIDSS